MSGKKQKISMAPGQPPKDAELMEVVTESEPWSTYELSDGTVIKTKTIAAEIWKVENEYDEQGNPKYVLKATPVVNVSSPDSIKRKVN